MSASLSPKAYQQGSADFYGRDFLVTPDVLIPRPESEQIIDSCLDLCGISYLPGVKPRKPLLSPTNLTILDVGTGSGCLAITLALALPSAKVYASDISEKVLKIAQKNALKLKAPITLIISHLLEKVNITPNLIVANLPYVDPDWGWLDKQALSYEPASALYAEDHGLALIKELIDQAAARHVKYLILEADPSQHSRIIEYIKGKYNLLETRGFVLVIKSTS